MSPSKDNIYGKYDPTSKPLSCPKTNPVASQHGFTHGTTGPNPEANEDQPSEARSELVDGSPQQVNNSSEGAAKSSNQDSTVNCSPMNATEPSKDNGTYPLALNLVPPSSESSPGENWSFEQIAETLPGVPRFAPYSEQTLKQAEIIKHLVEEQEKETQEKLEKQSTLAGGLPAAETPFAKEIDEMREAVRLAREEERREEEEKEKANKSDK